MKTYQIKQYGTFDGLQQTERAAPHAQAGQIVVKMRAVSLNYRDLMTIKGTYGAQLPPDLVPLSDGAGEIVEVGESVAGWQIGDRVAGIFFQEWLDGRLDNARQKSNLGGALDGVFSEYVVFPAHGVVRIPAHLSFEEAATLPCAAVTAWHALQRANLSSGETLLLLGTGGVSIFGLQFAKARGARVIITSSSDTKLQRARELGADETINYRTTPNWDEQVFALTNRVGADCVLEVGGNGTFEKSLRSLRMGGTLSLIGGVSGFGGQVNPFAILAGSLNVHGIYVGSREMFENMNRALEVTQMRPIIDRVFDFDDAISAFQYLESGAHFGKVVIKFND